MPRQNNGLRPGLLDRLLQPEDGAVLRGLLPQFVARSHGRVWLQLLVLGVLFVAVGLVTGKLRSGFSPPFRALAACTPTLLLEPRSHSDESST